ncbi:Hint domain-containing protein [Cochlodiniinecator piscidefendens]|uniref:Hint domain-containing protein n=1 Tax=Cochlodiniinecator piscidefendens TaxID=2715756 RepID=UPI001409CCF2|nr:Hint domain-containing protein [Cochlodiniinecator piscidefendens]
MPQYDIILNGDFSNFAANWSGTDIEATYPERAYLGNGSSNIVSEIDGHSGQTTVLEQSFTINNSVDTTLNFDTALRNASNGQSGSEGFRVDILDSSGSALASQSYFPSQNSLTGRSLDVSFPSGGTYTLRFTELGPDNSLGAIVDNISMLVCFTAGTLVDTDQGPKDVSMIRLGDRVLTLDDGFQSVKWCQSRTISAPMLNADPKLRPIVFQPGALGENMPSHPLKVSPQHRMLITGWRAELLLGDSEVLVAAHRLTNDSTIRPASTDETVTYVHFMFDRHQIVKANGAWSESFFPSETSLQGVHNDAREEIYTLFPELRLNAAHFGETARIVARGPVGQMLLS